MTPSDGPGGPSSGQADASRLSELVETWRGAVTEFIALARDVPAEQWDLPTDLDGWSVKDNVAHTAHLEAVLAGTPEETITIEDAPHLKALFNHYTEQGVVARRGRDMATLTDEIQQATDRRYAELQENPPTDGSAAPPRTPGGVPWDNNTLLNNRPVDIWMHSQDIRRAIGRTGGFDCAAARHTIGRFGPALPMVLGKRVGPPAGTSVRIDLSDVAASFGAVIGEDGRAASVTDLDDPTVRIVLSASDFVVLAGGRRDLAATSPRFEGDADLGRAVLSHFAITP
ncbi:MAG: maleylpyruvate isomerase family mycothiol-dependent enzyme [Marmoricola sp.]